jgi:transcriptional regulator with XRE-family HTH domain
MSDEKLSKEAEIYISSVISKMELKNAREISNMTQAQVAEISKLSLNCISDIENDKGNPTFKSIQRYLNAIGYEIMFRKKSI